MQNINFSSTDIPNNLLICKTRKTPTYFETSIHKTQKTSVRHFSEYFTILGHTFGYPSVYFSLCPFVSLEGQRSIIPEWKTGGYWTLQQRYLLSMFDRLKFLLQQENLARRLFYTASVL